MVDIKGYEGLYQITKDGRVWSIRRKLFLKPTAITTGYLRVFLFEKGKGKGFYIHRLVATAYLEIIEGKEEVNHLDGDKTNNKVNNLAWVNRWENMSHAWDSGLMSNCKLREHVEDIRHCHRHHKETYKSLAERYSVNEASIFRVLTNRSYKGV